MVIILDDNLITYLDFKENGVATLLGTWIQWLAKEFETTIQSRLDQLPQKYNQDVFFYWVSAPTHSCLYVSLLESSGCHSLFQRGEKRSFFG